MGCDLRDSLHLVEPAHYVDGQLLSESHLERDQESLRFALMSVLVFFPWAIAHYVLAARTLKRDLFTPQSTPA